MSNPSDGPSTGRRTVLNLSQDEEQLFGCGTYWFWGEGCYWHPWTTDRKENILQRIVFQQRPLRCPQTMQKRETTDLSLNSVQLHRGPMGCLTCYPVLLGAQMSSHHLSGLRVFIWSQLWLNASTCLLLMHSVCTRPSICLQGFEHHTHALWTILYGQRGLSLHSTGNRINIELDKPNTKNKR